MIRTWKTAVPAVVLMIGCAGGAWAGPYTDDLAKCLVDSTTPQDRASLVRWVFAAASRHPAVKPLANVSDETLDQENKAMADLFTRLLTESCRTQAQKAWKLEGSRTLDASFEVLGSVAGRELFASPEVSAGMAGLEKHLDGPKLEKALNGQ